MLCPLVECLVEDEEMERVNVRERENECSDSMDTFSGTAYGRSLREK